MISYSATVQIKPSFHMSGKSQTIGDFAVSRPSQILPIWRKNRRATQKPGRIGKIETLPNFPICPRIGKIETLPIFPICPRPFQMIGGYLRFCVGTVRKQRNPRIVWDFPDIWKPAFKSCWAAPFYGAGFSLCCSRWFKLLRLGLTKTYGEPISVSNTFLTDVEERNH